jgi:hypothetical protein
MTGDTMAGTSAWRSDRLVPALLAALATALVVLSIEPFPVGVFQDDGIYTVLAKSLASGQGYRYLQMPDAPLATHYPPFYPFLLAGLWKLFPSFPANVTLFKFVNAGFIGLTALLAWRFARRQVGMGPWTAALSVGAFAAGTPMVFLGVMALSEPMFMAALFPVLMVCERAARGGSTREALSAGAAGGLLAMIRTLGAVAIPATALVLAWRRQWKAAFLVCLAGGLVMLPWQLWVAAHDSAIHPLFVGKYGSYGGWLGEGIRTGGPLYVAQLAWFNFRLLVGQSWEMLGLLTTPESVRWFGTIAATAFGSAGWWLLLRRAPVAAWFVAIYMALVISWPFGPSRFTFAIWPVLGLQFGLGIEAVVRWRPRARPSVVMRYVAAGAAMFLAVGYARYNYLGHAFGWWRQVQEPVAERARYLTAWVNTNTPEDVLIATEDDVLMYLYTGRHAIPLGTFTPHDLMRDQSPEFMTETLGRILRSYDVDYVLPTTEFGARAATGLLRSDPPVLEVVGALKRGAIFRTRVEEQHTASPHPAASSNQ